MNLIEIKILETSIAIILFLIFRIVIIRLIDRTVTKSFLQKTRGKITVSIIDKDYEVEGRISDIGLFFVKLKTKQGEEVSLPNNIFLQKMIKKKMI